MWWALQVVGVGEWIVKVIQAMYDEATTMEKFELLRSGMEDKGLRVNMDKTKVLVCRAKPVQSGKPRGKWPCGVCGKGGGGVG